MLAETVDIFGWGDEVAEVVSLGFVKKGELDDDAMDALILIGLFYFGGNISSGRGAKIGDGDADVGTVFDFEIDVFGDDWVVAVADDEKVGFGFEAQDLVSLALLDEAGEFATVEELGVGFTFSARARHPSRVILHRVSPLALAGASSRIRRRLCR